MWRRCKPSPDLPSQQCSRALEPELPRQPFPIQESLEGAFELQISLPRLRRPAVTVFGAAIFGALLAGAGPQLPAMFEQPKCADTVMKAVSSDRPVAGTYNCFDGSLQMGLQSVGVDSD